MIWRHSWHIIISDISVGNCFDVSGYSDSGLSVAIHGYQIRPFSTKLYGEDISEGGNQCYKNGVGRRRLENTVDIIWLLFVKLCFMVRWSHHMKYIMNIIINIINIYSPNENTIAISNFKFYPVTSGHAWNQINFPRYRGKKHTNMFYSIRLVVKVISCEICITRGKLPVNPFYRSDTLSSWRSFVYS